MVTTKAASLTVYGLRALSAVQSRIDWECASWAGTRCLSRAYENCELRDCMPNVMPEPFHGEFTVPTCEM